MQRHTRAMTAVVIALVAPLVVAGTAGAQEPPGLDDAAIPKSDPAPVVTPSETGSYVVVMVDEPLISSFAPDDLDTPGAEAEAAQLEAEQDDVLADAGISGAEKIQGFTNALNGFAATLTYEQALKVASDARVAVVLPDELRQPTRSRSDTTSEFLGLTGRGRAYASGLTGEGVIVGVIDEGIWPEHPSFADDGTYPPLGITLDESERSACDFGNTAHNPNDAPFTCNNKLIGARQMLDTYRALIGAAPDEFDSARDDDGHGTHTAGTAAGNAGVDATILGNDLGEITGIAPRARVIAYKGLANLGGFTSDLAAAIDQAVADGVDVINYSVGGGAGLNRADAIAFLFAADAGVFVATSAGNSGPAAGTIGGPADLPWITTVGASTYDRFLQGRLTLKSRPSWGKPDKDDDHGDDGHGRYHRKRPRRIVERYEGASVTMELPDRTPIVDAADAGNDLCIRGGFTDPSMIAGKVVLCRRGAIGRAEKGLAVYEAGGVGMVLYNNTDEDNLFTDTHWVPAVHVNNTDGVAIKEFIADNPDPTAQITKTAKSVKDREAPTMTIFSSRGENPSSADIIKPDITAPGLQIIAGHSPFPNPGDVTGELFQAIAGTSMSSPQVAGFYALLKQAHPDWTPAMAKSAIMTTADTDVRDIDGSHAGPFAMGAGHLNPGRVDRRGTAWNPGLVYDAGLFEYAAFTCGADAGIFTPGSCAFLDSIGVPSDASDLNYPSLGIGELAGSQTVVRTVTSVADRPVRYRFRADAPPGYHVSANPSSFTIAPGESVTFEITIANDGSGPVGEWRFGSYTWKSYDGYAVRSPIAVRGQAINTPPAVSGTGTEGSLSFDVQFGYTGPYVANSHGPVAPTVYSDTISQDPDQTYPSGDDGAGVDRIPITLSGAAFARWELVIPGPDDIDLFLEDSAGNIIASSTSGGTDEHIDLVLPADGDYTMVVHGWSIASQPELPYDLFQWVVSATPGGPMTIDSAPTSAVTGTTGTIAVSWAGLDPATRYLGAVSHADAAGLLGLTLVEITT